MRVAFYALRIVALGLFALGFLAAPFAMLYFVGASGTGGRENTGELGVTGLAAVIGILGGLAVWRVGSMFRRDGS